MPSTRDIRELDSARMTMTVCVPHRGIRVFGAYNGWRFAGMRSDAILTLAWAGAFGAVPFSGVGRDGGAERDDHGFVSSFLALESPLPTAVRPGCADALEGFA